MRRFLVLAFLLLWAVLSALAAVPPAPKLVLVVVIDQFRYDYLTRFRAEYSGGLATLLKGGAVFTDAQLIHYPSVTAVGHSTVLSGALPAASGIVSNEWYDRAEGRTVTSVFDDNTTLLGGAKPAAGSSPRRLLASTVGDELKALHPTGSRVIGISLKDRAAILTTGHLADGAYWFDGASGRFVSSTYYFADLPAWVKQFNGTKPADHWAGGEWMGHKLPSKLEELYPAIEATPYANELIEQFAERALDAEQLGKDADPDILAVSFSANDYVGHAYGPFSPEARAASLAVDQSLQRLLQAVDRRVGLNQTLVVLTADHGVAPAPPRDNERVRRSLPGGRIAPAALRDVTQSVLEFRYGPGAWIQSFGDWVYLNRALIERRNLNLAEVQATAARAIAGVPHVLRVYTHSQILAGALPADDISRRVQRSFQPARSADITYILEPFWIVAPPSETGTTTTHGGPFDYDTHIPLIFFGTGIRAGTYDGAVALNDLAPTLARVLKVETPSGSVGRVLDEIWR